MYDAIVVGARCGGSPTALNLARKGHSVLVLDRSHFPSDTLSTHVIGSDAIARLRSWGVLDRILAEDGSKLADSVAFHVDGQRFELPGEVFAPRRTFLDKVLVDAARESGAEVREGASVSGLLRDENGVVTGVSGQAAGEPFTAEAKVVVGADGRNSFVAREVNAEKYHEQPSLNVGYYSYFADVPAERAELHFADGHACFFFPTSYGQTLLAAERPAAVFEELRADIDRGIRKAFDTVGQGHRLDNAKRVEDWKGASQLPNFYRKPFGPGWALVGDAGYLKDPVLGQGINDAFRDAELLSAALDRTFRGEQPFDEAMSAYQAERDAASQGVYGFNYEFAKLHVTPAHVQMLVAAATSLRPA